MKNKFNSKFEKYNSTNIFAKIILNNFKSKVLNEINKFDQKKVIDIGCGDGFWVENFLEKNFEVIGVDYDESMIKESMQRLKYKSTKVDFLKVDIYHNNFVNDLNNLIKYKKIENLFMSEVLEHLKDPEEIIAKISKLNFKKMIITVPNEPLWRILNMMRLKYVKFLGNTPGHINHFNKKYLSKILLKHFKIVTFKSSIPFLIFIIEK